MTVVGNHAAVQEVLSSREQNVFRAEHGLHSSGNDAYRIITDPVELQKYLGAILKENGSEPPSPGTIAVVEFDEHGQVVAYQLIKMAVFLEGLWARNKGAHLRSLWNLAHDYLLEIGATGVLTLARNDNETGRRIGKAAERMGCAKLPVDVYRRMF
jgi:hypothetical protein